MGRAKEAWIEEQQRGFEHIDASICSKCVEDDFLKSWVRDEATKRECSFCGRKSQKPIAVEFDAFTQLILDGIAFDWNDPDSEGIAYESAEGGYQADLTDAYDLIIGGEIEGISENTDVLKALVDSIGWDKAFVSRDFYVGSEEENYTWAWDEFRDFVLHDRRFLFSYPDELKEKRRVYREINPSDFLEALGSVLSNRLRDAAIRTLDQKTDIFRIRIDHVPHESAAAIGPPPQEHATQSNRMSPAGIPMFYGAFDYDTAHAETFDIEHHQGQAISCGLFRPTRNLRVLDLANLPFSPSIFDEVNQNLIRPLRFLRAFSWDIAKPIARDGREHIEYVPTQIVTEYFRHIYRTTDGVPLDGIVYRSSKANGTTACVLFCENDQAIELNDHADNKHLLRLISVRHP